MPDIYDGLAGEPLDIDGFHDAMAQLRAGTFDDAYIEASARLLARLGSNEDLLYEVFADVKSPDDIGILFKPPQSFLLAHRGSYYLRMNIWLPEQPDTRFHDFERELYAYDLAHNHDFRLLTVGYFGPGYETDMYDIPESQLDARPGDAITLRNHRRAQLEKGRVIHFAPYTDVHVQHYPSALSISINLIFLDDVRTHEQMTIDTSSMTMSNYVQLSESRRLLNVVSMTEWFRSPGIDRQLAKIDNDARDATLRTAAVDALARVHGAQTPRIAS